MADYGPYTGVVASVYDGDTVNVVLDIGFDLRVHTRIRVLGINAPETSTAAGKAAREFARNLLKDGTPVKVVSKGWDKFGGRIDGVITFFDGEKNEVNFAEAMKAAGHAKAWDGTGVRPV